MDNLDRFFTNENISIECISKIDINLYDIILEPSAGDGSFSRNLPKDKTISIDIYPSDPSIKKMDFFRYYPIPFKKYLVIGNPPFGNNSILAVKFFEYASIFSDTIAFILPRTFRKPSIINRLNPSFYLIKETILPPYSFHYPDGKEKNVPTVFQIWNRENYKRKKISTELTHEDFGFSNRDDCTLAIRRVGINAGKVFFSTSDLSKSSHYFIKCISPNCKNIFIYLWENLWNPKMHKYSSTKYDTAGNPSISKDDLIKEYKKCSAMLVENIDNQNGYNPFFLTI